MIIVSQEKARIVNFENILQIYITNDEKIEKYYIRYEDVNNSYEDLGRYNSLERAKEVLEEIIKQYSMYLELKGGAAILQGQMDVQPNIFNIPKIYRMPKE